MDYLAGIAHDTNSNVFMISDRRVDSPQQDPVRIQERDHSGRLVKDWGTHVSLRGALKFAAARGFNREFCPNCDQWRDDGDCYNRCAERGFAAKR